MNYNELQYCRLWFIEDFEVYYCVTSYNSVVYILLSWCITVHYSVSVVHMDRNLHGQIRSARVLSCHLQLQYYFMYD